MIETFRRRLSRGDLLLGTMVSIASPEVAEILALAGFDWLFIDMEHGAIDIATAQQMLQAAGPGKPGVVRTPSRDEVWIKKCLDIGASGIIVPQVKSADDAERVIQFSRYPPLGSRSVGISRAHGYGTGFRDYVARANDEIAVILQIEHIEAVRNIEPIVKVQGIDALFVGPYDLSGSMGKIGEVNDPDVQEAIARVRDCASRAEVPLGIFALTPDSARAFIEAGFTLIAAGMDSMLLADAAREMLAPLRR
jgi:2-dehydro-3-deoxyglucarate aldolase